MTCYLCSFRLSGIEGLFLWQEGEPDAVVTDDTGDIAVFRDVEALRRFTGARGLVLDDAVPVTYDLDRVAQWVAQGGSEDLDCAPDHAGRGARAVSARLPDGRMTP